MPLIEVIHSSNSINISSSNSQNNGQPLPEGTATTTALSTIQTREEQESLTSIAREAIQSLVEHYRQPIHLIAAASLVDDEEKKTTITNGSLPPFVEHWLRRLQHEQLLQHSNTNLMIMVQSLVHSYVTSIRSTLLVTEHVSGLYHNEESSKLASVNPNGVSVLVHYELLLSQFLQRQEVVAIMKDEKYNKSTGNDDVPLLNKTEDGMNNNKNTGMANVAAFAEALLCIACDITRLTSFCSSITTSNDNNEPSSSPSSESSMSYLVPNVVLPTMVRLLQRIQSYIQKNKESVSGIGATASTDDSDDILTSAMRRCDVSILAFGMPCLGPVQIHADLGTRTDTNTVLQRYAVYPPPRLCSSITSHKSMDPTMTTTTRCNSEEQNTTTTSSSSNNCYMSTSFVQSDNGKAWEQDPVTRAALAYWKFKSSSSSSSSSRVPSSSDCDAKNNDISSSLMRDAQQRYLSIARRQESCDNDNNNGDRQSFLLSMARAVRAHFFGRDMKMPKTSASASCTTAVANTMDNRGMSRNHAGNSTITTVQHQQGLQLHQQRQQQHQNQPRLHLGRWTTTKPSWSKDATQAPFRVIPSRIHVACQFISLLTVEDEVFVAGKNGSHKNISIAEELLPIVMELLSAPVYTMQAWGATCLLHLLSLETTTAPEQRRHDDAINDPICTLNPVQIDNLLSLFQLNIQTCREGPVLAVLGMAQQELLRRSFMDDTKRQSLARRKATQEWLLMLSKNLHSYQHSSDNNHLVWGALVGGIAPLFYDHCTLDEDPDASLIELGRLGLLSLLDLIRNAYQSYSILEDDDELIDVDNRMAPLPSDSMKHKAEQQDIQLLSLLALSNLMVAAHPIMPHHGGKIACALLSACCSCTAVRYCEGENVMTTTVTAIPDSSPVVFEWAYHVAAMAIVSCGNRAIDILDMVPQESDTDQDDDDFKVVQEIKRRADEMMSAVTSATKS